MTHGIKLPTGLRAFSTVICIIGKRRCIAGVNRCAVAWTFSLFLFFPPLVANAGICVNDNECNDGKPCTKDSCDPQHANAVPLTGCVHLPRLYWTDTAGEITSSPAIQRATSAGIETLVISNGFIQTRDLALDVSAGKVYFSRFHEIRRANLDGSGMETLLSVSEFAYDLALDLNAGKIYFIDVNNELGQGTRILRTNLDGSGLEVVVGYGANQNHLDIDSTTGTLYWIEPNNNPHKIRRLLPSGGIQNIVVLSSYRSFNGLAVEPAGGKVYWAETDYTPQPILAKIRRANLDGSNVEDLVVYESLGGPGDNTVRGLTLEPASGKMYWSTGYNVNANAYRANFDGSDMEVLATHIGSTLEDIDVDAGTGMIYWVDSGSRTLRRAEISGFSSEVLLSDLLVHPLGLAADTASGKIYWTDFQCGCVRRSDSDGSNIEDLVTSGLKRPLGMALDLTAGKMYWANNGFHSDPGSIQRADLNGSNVENVVTSGVYQPNQIALDLNAGMIYWTDSPPDSTDTENPKQIARANLDGSNVEVLVNIPSDGVMGLSAITLNLASGHLYWSEAAFYGSPIGSIRRANLDGSNVVDIVSAASEAAQEVRGLVVDSVGGSIYWTDQGESASSFPPPPPPVTPAIRRANLNGSNVSDVLTTGLAAPYALCMTCCRQFGDVFPVTRTDGLTEIDVDDIMVVLGGFIDPLTFPGADIFPCGGNGVIDVDDIVTEINAFTGSFSCLDSCPP